MITALSEYIDMIYTTGATRFAGDERIDWWGIEISPKTQPIDPKPRVCIKVHDVRADRTYKTDVPFAAVEEGHRCGAEELAFVAEYHINRVLKSLDGGHIADA